jgi:predicted ATP-grasp superfamily ATP-dependent carboligase
LRDPAEPSAWAAAVDRAAEQTGHTPAVVAGATVTGLAFVRSLGRRGVPVFTLDHRSWEIGMLSRYSRPLVLPDPGSGPGAWADFLLRAGASLRSRPALIPTGDAQLRALVPAAERLAGAYSAVLPPAEIFQRMADKCRQYSLLEAAGAPLPKAVQPADETDLERAAAAVGLPCVVKPGLGDLWTQKTGRKLDLVHTLDELRSAFHAMTAAGVGVLVQELIPGGDDAFFGCICHIDAAGVVRACFTKRKLRQFPPGFGNGSYQISVDSPEAREISLRLLRDIGYHGTAAVEYKIDSRDNRLKLIEINCRSVSGTQLAVESDVDLPWIVYRDAIGRPLDPVTEFAAGRRLVNFSWDARSYLRSGDHSPRGFGRWAKSVLQADADAVLSLHDPGPTLRTWSRFWR